jgi:hypothetical protein
MRHVFTAEAQVSESTVLQITDPVASPISSLQSRIENQQDCEIVGYGLDSDFKGWTEVQPCASRALNISNSLWQGDGNWKKIQPLYIRGSGAEESSR